MNSPHPETESHRVERSEGVNIKSRSNTYLLIVGVFRPESSKPGVGGFHKAGDVENRLGYYLGQIAR
jgi:hypothetical protein